MQVGAGVKGAVGVDSETVGEQDLFAEAHGEPGEADGEVVGLQAEVALLLELRHDFCVVQDGAGDEMGEEGDEEEVALEVLLVRGALLQVDEVGDLGEGEKGDAEREDDVDPVAGRVHDGGDAVKRRDEVFEVAEGGQVGDDGGPEQEFGGDGVGDFAADERAGKVVEQDGAAEQEEVRRPPEAVEAQRNEPEPDHDRAPVPVGGELVADQGDGHEAEDEGVGVEEHAWVAVA